MSDENESAADDSAPDAPAGADDPEKRTAAPKTAPDGTPIERAVPPERWEEVGRKVLGVLLHERADEVGRAVGELGSALDYGAPVDEAHLDRLRDAIEALETVVERDATDLVADAVPFERTVGRVPFGRMYDALDLDGEAVARLADDGD